MYVLSGTGSVPLMLGLYRCGDGKAGIGGVPTVSGTLGLMRGVLFGVACALKDCHAGGLVAVTGGCGSSKCRGLVSRLASGALRKFG